ncbi:phage tail family protein [Eubacteriales bacterium OttesenSCG-928-A19]|nr:phage tail family protein [Eubacteriales bacterium OttesenSCG-928-A19]
MNENTIFTYESSIGTLVFKYDSPFWITDDGGLSSVEIDIAQSRSAGQIGANNTSQSVRPRSFTLSGVIFEPLSTHRAQLINIIAPQMPATLTIQENGESWYLDVVPERTPIISPGNGVQEFQMRLVAAYPYLRSTAFYATQLAGIIGLFKFPFYTGGKWWISKYSDNYFSELENKGNVPQEFKVVFTARSAIENPELYHMGTEKRILIRKAMTAGERVQVSTVYGERGVTCVSASGEVTNGFKFLSKNSDLSMSLLPGINLLRIDAGYNRQGMGVRIEGAEGVKSGV